MYSINKVFNVFDLTKPYILLKTIYIKLQHFNITFVHILPCSMLDETSEGIIVQIIVTKVMLSVLYLNSGYMVKYSLAPSKIPSDTKQY